MKKSSYIQPKTKILVFMGKHRLLDGIGVGGTVHEGGDIGFSKRHDFEFEDDPNPHYNVWGDE